MLEDYQNKVCVVTGAASGIGKALCEKLVALGAQVYACLLYTSPSPRD
mgnify:FL=1